MGTPGKGDGGFKEEEVWIREGRRNDGGALNFYFSFLRSHYKYLLVPPFL
jgi:hypothetical protein